MQNLFLSALAALSLTAAVVPAANAAVFGMPQSSLTQHQGPYDDTGRGPQQFGLEGGGN